MYAREPLSGSQKAPKRNSKWAGTAIMAMAVASDTSDGYGWRLLNDQLFGAASSLRLDLLYWAKVAESVCRDSNYS